MRNYVKCWISSSCIAFTIEIISFIILPDSLTPLISEQTILQTFVLCVIGAAVAVLPPALAKGWTLKPALISYILLNCVIFGVGTGIFHLIPLELPVVLSIIVCSLIIYGICILVDLQKEHHDVEVINECLKGQKKGRSI